MKYKILVINDCDLVKDLEAQAKLGFEIVEFLDKQEANAYSSQKSWRVLLRSIKR